jgi:hypothetical protein
MHVTGPLPSNGCPIIERLYCGNVFTDLLPSNWYIHHIAPSLRLFIPNSPQAYRHFYFSRTVFSTSVIGLTFLPVA